MKKIRRAVDLCMIIILPMLMSYSLIGENLHEIIGTVMLALFIIHHILNSGWHRSLFKGKYPARRIFQNALDVLLFAIMIAQPASGILMSRHLYTFLQVTGASAPAREVHLFLGYWGLVLMCVHAGTHFGVVTGILRKKGAAVKTAVFVLAGAVSVYGIYAFVRRQMPAYMFRRSSFAFFDFSEPKIYFFLDYAAVMFLFATVGVLAVTGLAKRTGKQKKKAEK